MYADGKGVRKDEAKGVKLFQAAAAKGDAQGQFNLAAMYAKGRGFEERFGGKRSVHEVGEAGLRRRDQGSQASQPEVLISHARAPADMFVCVRTVPPRRTPLADIHACIRG